MFVVNYYGFKRMIEDKVLISTSAFHQQKNYQGITTELSSLIPIYMRILTNDLYYLEKITINTKSNIYSKEYFSTKINRFFHVEIKNIAFRELTDETIYISTKITISYKLVVISLLIALTVALMFVIFDSFFTNLKNEARYLVARQVAHDIRSPLASLDMVISTTKDIPQDQKRIIGHALRRIHDIANNLLETSRAKGNHSPQKVSLLVPIIDSILSEKRTELRKHINLSLDFNMNTDNFGLFTKADSSELKRVISNLINNSVEALPQAKGKITISASKVEQNAIIKVIDNGTGIPADVLNKLFKENISYNKMNGNGIGLQSAKETIETFGGTINIESILEKGTTVTITLPLAPTPPWFQSELQIPNNANITIIDDDRTIHSLWSNRIGSDVQINHLTHFEGTMPESDIYLVDYEFQNQDYNGLDKIIELNLKNAILVTSHYDESSIQEKAVLHSIKIIPKDILHLIPIVFNSSKNYDLVLLDDDELIRLSWETKAKLENKKILVVASFKELETKLSNIQSLTKFYIDSELGNGPKGEEIAKNLYDLGYKELYLCTGHSPAQFKNIYWIKGIQGKHFPS